MKGERRANDRSLLRFVLMALFAVAMNVVDHHIGKEPMTLSFYLSKTAYMSLFLDWGLSVRRRVSVRGAVNCLFAMSLCMVLFMLLQVAKYRLFGFEPPLERLMWYLFSVPTGMIPLLGLCASLYFEYPVLPVRLRWAVGALGTVTTALIAAICLNDLHLQAYSFPADLDHWEERFINDYSHGPLYWAEMAWLAVLCLMTAARAVRRCAIPANRRKAWGLAAVFAAAVLFSLDIANAVNLLSIGGYRIIQLSEGMSLLVIAGWEYCFRSGLLPTNRNYDRYFREMSLGAQISDRAGRVIYRTASWVPEEDLKAGKSGDLTLRTVPITGGTVSYEEDLSVIHRMQDRLREEQRRLSEKVDLMDAENRARAERLRTEEQNALYDRIFARVLPQREAISASAARLRRGEAANPDRELARIAVLGACIKRMANLLLLSERGALVDGEELTMALREALHCLSKAGVRCAVTGAFPGKAPGDRLCALFEGFGQALTAAGDGLTALLVHCARAGEDALRLTLSMDPPVKAEALSLPQGVLARTGADGALVLETGEGGDEA